MDDRNGVAVVGSINADLAAFGSPLPRPGETVIGTDFSLGPGGGKERIKRSPPHARSADLHDRRGGRRHLRDLTLSTLADEGVDVTAVRVTDGATGIAHIRVDAPRPKTTS